jgi:hypothetical protein
VHIDEEGENVTVGEMEIERGADGCHVGLMARKNTVQVIRKRIGMK